MSTTTKQQQQLRKKNMSGKKEVESEIDEPKKKSHCVKTATGDDIHC